MSEGIRNIGSEHNLEKGYSCPQKSYGWDVVSGGIYSNGALRDNTLGAGDTDNDEDDGFAKDAD